MKPDLRLRTAGADVDVRALQCRVQLEVEVQLSLRNPGADSTLVEERAQPFALLRGEHDSRGFSLRGELGDSPRPAHERLQLDPAEIHRLRGRLARRQLNPGA